MEKCVKELKRAALLERDQDLSQKIDASGSSFKCYHDSAGPLDAAAIGDRFAVAQQLLQRGFNPNAASPHGTTPLHTAAKCNSEAVADCLIKSGAHLGVPDAAANTPLTLASGLGHSGIVNLLLKADSATTANLEHRDSFGNSALHLAAAGDYLEVVNLLFTWSANVLAVNDFGETPLTVAEKNESRRVCEYLEPRVAAAAAAAAAEEEERRHSSSIQQLVMSVLQDRLQDVRAASLDKLASRSPDGKTLLHWAAIGDADECAEHLLGCGLSVDATDQAGSCPLHYAALNGAERITRRLLAAGADAGQQEATNGMTPLMLCVLSGSEPVAKLLQQTGQVRLDAVDMEGETALMLAARMGSESLARLAVKDSNNVMRKNRLGLSAIEISALNGHRAVSELLEKYRGVYPRRSPKKGYCLVINQVYSSPPAGASEQVTMRIRDGSKHDVKRICDVFGFQLSFEVHERSDLTRDGILQVVRRIGSQLDSVDYFACFILAHGQGDAVFGTDGELVQLSEIAERLNSEHCRELVGKPKLFFIQACRNNWNSEPHRGKEPSNEEEEEPSLTADRPLDVAKYIDNFFGFSTWEDCVSYSSAKKGSIYIQALCDVVEEHHGQMDLLKMMTRVCHRVGSTPVPGKGSCYMVPNIKSSLQKDVKF